MSRNYKIRDQESIYFISFATVNWIDVFTRTEYKDIVVESLKFCIVNKGLELYSWCIMTDHVHLIIGTQGEKMEDILRDIKRHTAKKLLLAIAENIQESRREWMLWIACSRHRDLKEQERNPNNERYQFLQQHNKPIQLWNHELLMQKLNYIHNNPVQAGFVEEPWEYLYSSAKDYSGKKGLIDIKM